MKEKIIGLLLIIALVVAGYASGIALDFIFFFPLFTAFIWIIGGIYFYNHWERHSKGPDTAPALREQPFISILIPCHNEAPNLPETIAAANEQNYPDFEIIAINDGSTDDTVTVLDRLAKECPRLRIIHLAQNQGKAMALRMGALAAKGEYLVCVDGDALLHKNAAAYLVKPMIENVRVGAVTGNPRVRNRSSLLGKIQVGEFSSIIGLIKRAQRIYGQLFTVSGVIASFRRTALHECGYWSLSALTEDIDISWRLQLRHWAVQYEPNALAWILMPETLTGLWKQRLRWAQGGAEVFFKNILRVWIWRNHRMWPMIGDMVFSLVWAVSYMSCIVLWVVGKFVEMPPSLNVPTIWPPVFWGLALATVNILQFVVALKIESRYEPKLFRTIGWIIWYPMLFWMLTLFTTTVGFVRAIAAPTNRRGLWRTSDRGFK